MTAGARVAVALAREVAGRYAALHWTRAVALGGSITSGTAGADSDVDLYVYASPEIPIAERRRIALAGTSRWEIDNRFFEPGDEWVDAATGLAVDLMYRHPAWIEEQLDALLVRHQARTGYTTAFWHGVRASLPLFDRGGWYARLQARAQAPYPEPLRRAIVARNHPLLRGNLSSFLAQMRRAAARGDAVSLQHRAAAFLASWFDLLFALNRQTHPGEKRLVALAEATCPLRPPRMAEQVRALVEAVPAPEAVARADELGEELDRLLRAAGLIAP
jgi:hypothetical protein